MRKSKHFRKDVILARVIFGLLCIAIIVLICMGVSALTKNLKDDDTKDKETQQTEIYDIPEFEDAEEDTQVEEVVEEIVVYAKTTAKVNMRVEPNTNCDIVASVPAGTKTSLIEEITEGTQNWYRVSYNGAEGYIRGDYIELIEETVFPRHNRGIIMLDPGHQAIEDKEKEPNGPGATDMKQRVAAGTKGDTTGVYEYELVLEIGLMLRDELESRGFTVLMTRETHDVNISNMERAQMANEANADIVVHLHGNSFDDSGVYGAETVAPSTGNIYVNEIADESQKLSQRVLNAYCEATGMKNRGVKISDTMTGINWSQIPVTIVELGYMSNPTDDTNMQDDAYQKKMVQGLATGIEDYFCQ